MSSNSWKNNTETRFPYFHKVKHEKDVSTIDVTKKIIKQLSSFLRDEIELIKFEIVEDMKKFLSGSIYLITSMVTMLYSIFFYFCF